MLGELETQVMEILWGRETATVRDVHQAIHRHRPLAYTTIMTVMSRLAEKGILARETSGGAYLYRPAEPRQTFEARAANRLLREALDRYGDTAISSFVELIAEDDPAQIAELSRLLEAKRRTLSGGGKRG